MTDYPLTDEQISAYRRDGFISLPQVFAGDELRNLRDAVATAVASESKPAELLPDGTPRAKGAYELIFNQKVNLWRRHPRIAEVVSSKRLGNIAATLEGVPMRVWHDQALFKEPATTSNKTPWHQDAPYWPHQDRQRQTSIWIALKDATVLNGCMAFVGGTHKIGPLPAVDLVNPQDIFLHARHIKPVKPKVVELPAGNATFHNGLTFHYAGPNRSDSVREAFAIIYMPDGTTYDAQRHIITDGLGLEIGQKLLGEMFPLVSG
jgi:phytanoyl-CoA hydroxylase